MCDERETECDLNSEWNKCPSQSQSQSQPHPLPADKNKKVTAMSVKRTGKNWSSSSSSLWVSMSLSVVLLAILGLLGGVGGQEERDREDSGGVILSGGGSGSGSGSSASCPVRCLCFRTTVRCMFLHLEKIPDVPKDTTVLDLRFNRIREVPPNSFQHLTHLNTLLLNNNHISRLENGAFNGLDQLKFLYLYKNRIRRVEPFVFRGLINLEQLYLHYNSIEFIEGPTFSNLTKLERLFLHNNKIERIPHGSFDNLHKMKRLRLDSNALVCDCGMVGLAEMLVSHPDTQAAATCQQPASMQGKPITALQDMKLHCRKPTITEEPRDVEVNFGSTVYFTCKVDGDPAPNIVWLHNSNEISPSVEPRYSVLNDGTLMIANAQDEDAGGYECMAKSMVGEVKSRRAKMQYKNKAVGGGGVGVGVGGSYSNSKIRPRFVQVPGDTEVAEGGNVVLHCEAVGGRISWSFNDQPLHISSTATATGTTGTSSSSSSFSSSSTSSAAAGRHTISAGGSLVIQSTGRKDEGVYRCTAANNVGKIAAIAQLRVLIPPVWLATPLAEQSIQVGSTLELKCEAGGKPTPHVTWTHNGQPIRGSGQARVALTHRTQRVRIRSVIQEDEGEYGCRAENSAGHLEIAVNLRVIPGAPPVFTNDFTRLSQSIRSGGELVLECSATGTPRPQMLWRRNGLTVLETSRISLLPSGRLIISPFNPGNDPGLYECSAFNDHGLITSPPVRVDRTSVHVFTRQHPHLDDATIFSAISEARRDVETAENDTLNILFGNASKMEVRHPHDLLRLFRFPKAEGREIARSAEIYERALQIIARHANSMNFSLPVEFSYKDLLTRRQLETLGRFSGCIGHREPKRNCSEEMCFHSRYRSIDGTCNNLAEPMWGTSYTPFQRLMDPVYENGFNLPIGWDKNKLYNGYKKPLARLVSTRIITTENVTPDTTYTHMLMQWGQFVDHDLDHALPSLSIESFGERISCRRTCENVAPCFPMEAPPGDLRVRSRKCIEFTRSAAVCGSGITSIMFDNIQQREQINQLTSFIDASQVYGSSEEELAALRSRSHRYLLRSGIAMARDKPLMPFATDETPVDCRRSARESDVGCFIGGDIRANEQLGLLAMHTVWFRQHNFVANKLKQINPTWQDEVVFQETRKVIGAQMQHITYTHWLPYVIGQKGMEQLGPYDGYKPGVNPTITTEFATAALRFGHTLINPVLRRLDANFQSIREGDLPLRNAFFAPWRLVEEGGIDPLLRGLFSTAAKLKRPDQLLNSHLTDELFSAAHLIALDLAAMNIQRGRDHGLPSYNEYRQFCQLKKAESFDDLSTEIGDATLRRKLEEVYGHVDNIDLWVGGVAEDIEWEDARVGPTFKCVLVDMFRRLRDGDRFWYENPSVFKPEQLTQIKETTLARILCDNGDHLSHVKRDVFFMESPLTHCSFLPTPQFAFWSESCCGNGAPTSGSGFHPAACPILDSTTRRDVETNTITRRRRRRALSDEEIAAEMTPEFPDPEQNEIADMKHVGSGETPGHLLTGAGTGEFDAVPSSTKPVVKWKQLESTLSLVQTTVSKLKDRIKELENKCGNNSSTENPEADLELPPIIAPESESELPPTTSLSSSVAPNMSIAGPWPKPLPILLPL